MTRSQVFWKKKKKPQLKNAYIKWPVGKHVGTWFLLMIDTEWASSYGLYHICADAPVFYKQKTDKAIREQSNKWSSMASTSVPVFRILPLYSYCYSSAAAVGDEAWTTKLKKLTWRLLWKEEKRGVGIVPKDCLWLIEWLKGLVSFISSISLSTTSLSCEKCCSISKILVRFPARCSPSFCWMSTLFCHKAVQDHNFQDKHFAEY